VPPRGKPTQSPPKSLRSSARTIERLPCSHENGKDTAGLPVFAMKKLAGTTLAQILAEKNNGRDPVFEMMRLGLLGDERPRTAHDALDTRGLQRSNERAGRGLGLAG
jgi:hypothetical protein